MQNTIPNEIKTLSVDEVMALIGVKSYATMLKYMDDDKKLPFLKVGKQRRFTFEHIKEFYRNCNPTKKPH